MRKEADSTQKARLLQFMQSVLDELKTRGLSPKETIWSCHDGYGAAGHFRIKTVCSPTVFVDFANTSKHARFSSNLDFDRLRVVIRSSYVGRSSVRGHTWEEKPGKPVSVVKVADMLMKHVNAMIAGEAMQKTAMANEAKRIKAMEKLRKDFPKLARAVCLDDFSLKIQIKDSDEKYIRKILIALTQAGIEY